MKEFFKNKINWLLVGSSLILNIGLFLFFLFFIKQNTIPIVLHYNIDWGVDYLGEVKSIFNLPIVGMTILLLNTFLALKTWKESKILSYFLMITSILAQIFLVISGLALYFINK
ncbi:MAG: hypothetical protein Q8P06_01975 [Candidatus Azambacteria bacterium]|nr:hypothetical protein [Candidatus Azambacteria bacterium]